jgi:hypothetical protein
MLSIENGLFEKIELSPVHRFSKLGKRLEIRLFTPIPAPRGDSLWIPGSRGT